MSGRVFEDAVDGLDVLPLSNTMKKDVTVLMMLKAPKDYILKTCSTNHDPVTEDNLQTVLWAVS